MKSERLDYRVGWKGNEGTACYINEKGLRTETAGRILIERNKDNVTIRVRDAENYERNLMTLPRGYSKTWVMMSAELLLDEMLNLAQARSAA